MSETVKVEKWAYPFRTGTSGGADPQQFYAALAKASDGFYPLGSNGLWHGGVHFDDATGMVSSQSEVRCIADGEVVAYRIDERYPISEYESGNAVASTGFVLVRHTLEFPSPPPASAPAPAPAGGPSLVFYSLYMHMLDKAGYDATPSLVRPSYWVKGNYQVKATAKDPVLGLNVRGGVKGTPEHGQVLATLPRRTTVTAGESSADGKWLKVVSVTPSFGGLAANTGWVFKSELQSLGGDQYLVGSRAKDAPAEKTKGLNVRESASTAGAILSVLPGGTEITISEEGASGDYRKLVSVVTGTAMPTLTPDASGQLPGYVWLRGLETKSEPKQTDSVVILEKPVKISAGALVGHVGLYQNEGEAKARNLLRLEVFSCDDLKSFMNQCRGKASSLPAKLKSLVKIYKGTKVIEHQDSYSATSPPKVSDPGKPIGYDFIVPASVLNNLPESMKIKVKNEGPAAANTTYWWHLKGLLGNEQNEVIDGWVAEQDLVVTRHNPWEWLGFDFIEETVSNVDHMAADLHSQDKLSAEEKKKHLTKVSTSAKGPMKERLIDLVDADGNNNLSPAEIKTALGKPWHAQSIAKLVVAYESEWFHKAQKWDALDELMEHSPADPNLGWAAEKKRIEAMAWWGEASGVVGNAAGICSEFHPVGLIENFIQSYKCNCKVDVKVTRYGKKSCVWSHL